jgi:DNA-binding XRE family transcriptional regulator
MARRTPAVDRELTEFGESLRSWRSIRALPSAIVAERAGISRDTLRSIEAGKGTASIAAVFAVIEALGISSVVTQAVEPLNTELGRNRAALINRKRVRTHALR